MYDNTSAYLCHGGKQVLAELTRLAKNVYHWDNEILAYHTSPGASNGPTEAVKLLIEKIRHIGHGYRNYNNYQRRQPAVAA